MDDKRRQRRSDATPSAVKTLIARSLKRGKSAHAVAQAVALDRHTVQDIAHAKGLRPLAPTRTTPLSQAQKRSRLRFARHHLKAKTNWNQVTSYHEATVALRPDGDSCVCAGLCECSVSARACVYRQVLFSDETAIQLHAGTHRRYWSTGERRVRVVTSFAPKVLFWGALGANGSSRLVKCGRVNAGSYAELLKRELFPITRRNRTLIFQQANLFFWLFVNLSLVVLTVCMVSAH